MLHHPNAMKDLSKNQFIGMGNYSENLWQKISPSNLLLKQLHGTECRKITQNSSL